MIRIETKNLFLKPMESSDVDAVFAYRSDKLANKFQSWIPKTVSQVCDFIEALPNEINLVDTWFQFVIIKKESNIVIGDVGLHFIGEFNEQVEIGITLSKKEHKKGYARESLASVLDFLFNNLTKHRVIGSVDKDNESSIRLLKKLGFRREAHFKKSIFINGYWVDDVIYGILREEWQK